MTATLIAPTESSQATERRQWDTVSLVTVYVFFLMAIPSRFTFGPLGGAGAPSTILGAVFFIAFIMRWLHPSSMIGKMRQPIRLAGLGLFCAFLASYVSASIHKMASLEQNGADRGIIMICGWLGIMLLTADGIENRERLNTLLGRLVLGASGMAALGMLQFFTGFDLAKYIVIPGLTANQAYTDISTRGSFYRPSATAIHPLEFGFVLVTILPIAIHRARYAPKDRKWQRWLQVGLISATLPMTVSRSAILGFAVAMIVILPVWPSRDRWVALLVIVLSVLGLQVVVPGMIRSLNNLFFAIGSDTSTTSRTVAFSNAVPLISQHPLFGVSFGTFMPQTYFFTDDQYLNSVIEIGFVGVLALLTLFITGWCIARQTRRTSADPETRHLAQCMAASAAIIICGFATFDVLYFPMAAGLTFLTLGCIGAMWRLNRKPEPKLAPRR